MSDRLPMWAGCCRPFKWTPLMKYPRLAPLDQVFHHPRAPQIDPDADAPVFDSGQVSMDGAERPNHVPESVRPRPVSLTEQLDDMLSEFLVHDDKGKVKQPKALDRPVLDAKIQSFIRTNGVTQVPTGFVTTKYGAQALSYLRGQSKANAAAYRRKHPEGSSGYRAQQ